jgi:hypothetical protein
MRSIGAGLFGVVAVIGLLASSVAIWASSVLFDSDRFAQAVDATLDRPEVTRSLALYLTDEVVELVGLETLVEEALPPRLEVLKPAILGGARSLVANGFERILVREDARAAVATLTRSAHAATLRVLEGDAAISGVSISGDEVSVNLLPLVGRGVAFVQDAGWLTNYELPPLTLDGDPTMQIAALEQSLSRELPEDFGQLVVFRSEAVDRAGSGVTTARDMLSLVRRGFVAILALTAAAMIASVVVAHRRRRAVIVLAIGAALALFTARMVIDRIIDAVPEAVSDLGAKVAIATAVDRLAGALLQLFSVLAVLGLLAALIAWVAGPGVTATRLRMRLARVTEAVPGL